MDIFENSPPCLLCCKNLTDNEGGNAEGNTGLTEADNVVIKTEINDEEPGVDNDFKFSACLGNMTDEIGNENMAAEVRGEDVSLRGTIPQNPQAQTTADEDFLYHSFVKWFKLSGMLANTTKISKRKKLGWDVTSGKERLPFCMSCKTHLEYLLELQNQVDQLEKQIRTRVESLKEKATSAEELFQSRGIYQKDIRYRRVRKQIVSEFKSERLVSRSQDSINEKVLTPNIGGRKSTRIKSTTQLKFSLSSNGRVDTHDLNKPSTKSSMLPIVMLSTSDVASAEQRRRRLVASSPVRRNDGGNDTKPDTLELSGYSSTGLLNEESNDGVGLDDDWRDSIISPTKVRKRTRKIGKTTKTTKSKKKMTSKLKLNGKTSQQTKKKKTYNDTKNSSKTCKKPRKWLIREEESDYEVPDLDSAAEDTDNDLKSPSTKKKRPQRKRKVIDEDYTVDKTDEEAILREEEDDSDSDSDIEGGNRTKRLQLDPVAKTLTYKRHVFRQVDPLNDHIFQCSQCNDVIEHKDSRIRHHVFRHHSDKFACSQCQYRGVSKATLKRHVQATHEGAPHHRPVNCRICDKPTNICRIKLHEWSHKNEEERRLALEAGASDVPPKLRRKFQCDECGRDFATRVSLESHKLRIHGTEEEKDSRMELCPECGGTYLELKKHLQSVHVKKKTYQCLESGCGLKFNGLAQLTKHKNAVHRKIRPFQCTKCPRDFTHQKNLSHHMNLHMGIRPWQCEHCPSAFTTKSQVQRHMKSYHTEGVAPPKRKSYTRGPTMLGADIHKKELVTEGKYLPPSALATWAAGREPTSHFLPSSTSERATRDLNSLPGATNCDTKL